MMRGPQQVFLSIFAIAFGCFAVGCASPESARDPVKGQHDSTTVVLSKFYSSQNYRIWLGRLAEQSDVAPLRFFQAYGAEAGALNQELSRASAIVLTGGEDVYPGLYGQEADTLKCGRTDRERDRVEQVLLDQVLAKGLPCLGVCRGLQIMNVHAGGTLRPHLPDDEFVMHRGGGPAHTKDTLHPVIVTRSWSIGRAEFPLYDVASVVSHHHQGIGMLAPSYEAWAISPDSLVEAIRYKDTTVAPFLVGVQWHPERSDTGLVLTDGLGRALLLAAKGVSSH